MVFNWQDAIALGTVAAAAAYLWRHVRRIGSRKKATGCGSCADCPMQNQDEPLVSIDALGEGKRG